MKSKLTILTLGSRGDVQPCVALALGLKAAGFDVTLAADLDFEQGIVARGLRYAPLEFRLRELLATPEGRAAMASGKSPARGDEAARALRYLDDCWAAARGADALIYDTMLAPAGYHIAEGLGIPGMMMSVMPNMSPTRAFPLIGGPKLPLGRLGHRLSYEIYRLEWFFAHALIKEWCRKTLGVSEPSRWIDYRCRGGRPIPIVYSYSPLVLPTPPDWPDETLASGYWVLPAPEGWAPPRALEDFLSAGPPPICVGFGSMIGLDPERTTRLVSTALQQIGRRAVLMTGWGGLTADAELPENIFAVADVDHDWLFQRAGLAVHHGGAGSTAAALRHGVPSVICPFVTDQFFWGSLLHRRGLGPPAIPQRKLTAERLAACISAALRDREMQVRVKNLGERVRQEDGIARAVQFILRHLDRSRREPETDAARFSQPHPSGFAGELLSGS